MHFTLSPYCPVTDTSKLEAQSEKQREREREREKSLS
jgi:hypothetical protein